MLDTGGFVLLNNRFVGLGLLALFGLSSVTVSARDTTDPYWDFRDEGESGEFAGGGGGLLGGREASPFKKGGKRGI